MKKIIAEATAIIAANALHRKGVRAQEVSREYTFNHLHGEVVELYEALRRPDPVDEQKDEMGDILGLLSHIFVREGWNFAEIEACGIVKLRSRWSSYTPPHWEPDVEHCTVENLEGALSHAYGRIEFLEARLTEMQALATKQAEQLRGQRKCQHGNPVSACTQALTRGCSG